MNNDKIIFLTNDDSYLSKGFRAAVNLAREFGRVIAIAPDRVQSGMSQAITINTPLFLRQVEVSDDVEIYAFSGTPVDCAKIAFDHFFKDKRVDLVLSGINHGSNAAVNVMYSGTMGAAIEGSFYGVPSIGLSLDDHDADADFEGAVKYGREIIASVMEAADRLPRPLCLNVNVPRCAAEEIQGIRLARQTRGFWREDFYARQDPHGRDYFWLTGAFQNAEPDAEDTDEWALAHRYVSVVPVQVDMTDYRMLKSLDGVIK
ncbi:MAG: 5'/3'-nucleotidase SurE [Alistipes sp.]|nr:5'/3'-nucleotidase SurE [Alistipes sp.]